MAFLEGWGESAYSYVLPGRGCSVQMSILVLLYWCRGQRRQISLCFKEHSAHKRTAIVMQSKMLSIRMTCCDCDMLTC